jgi:RecB family exonuclease
MEQSKEFHLSFSRIAVYDACPLRYKFIYVDKLPTIQRSYFSFGSSIHKVLEIFYHPENNFLKLKKAPSLYLKELLEENWISAGYKNKKEEEKAKDEAIKILNKFYRENIFGFKPAHLVEKSFSFKLDNFKVIGRIDRIDEETDGFKIIDYKTNRILPRFFREIDLLQPAIYYMAAQKTFDIQEIKAVSLFFVRYNKQVEFNLSDEFLKKSEEKIIRTGELILSKNFEPKLNGRCSTCEFKDICPVFNKK